MVSGPAKLFQRNHNNAVDDDDYDDDGNVVVVDDEEKVENILRSFPELNDNAVGFYEITALQVRIKI